MADTAAHPVDRVLPQVPVRQWVLSLPFALRYRLAYDAPLTSAVLGIFMRALFGSLRRRARKQWNVKGNEVKWKQAKGREGEGERVEAGKGEGFSPHKELFGVEVAEGLPELRAVEPLVDEAFKRAAVGGDGAVVSGIGANSAERHRGPCQVLGWTDGLDLRGTGRLGGNLVLSWRLIASYKQETHQQDRLFHRSSHPSLVQ